MAGICFLPLPWSVKTVKAAAQTRVTTMSDPNAEIPKAARIEQAVDSAADKVDGCPRAEVRTDSFMALGRRVACQAFDVSTLGNLTPSYGLVVHPLLSDKAQ